MKPWIALTLFGAWPFVSFLGHNQEDAPLYWNTVALYGLIFVALLAARAPDVLAAGISQRILETLSKGGSTAPPRDRGETPVDTKAPRQTLVE